MRGLVWIAVSLLAASTAHAGNAFLSEGGTWVGAGSLRESPTAPVQRGRCRFEALPLPDGLGVTASGKCAGTSGSANINLRVERRGNGVVAAGLSTSVEAGVVQYLGRETELGLELQSREPIDLDGQLFHGILTVKWLGNEAFMLSTVLKGDDGDAAIAMIEMEFARQLGGNGGGG